jgi:coenzyme Q-binding protein COQ10
MPGAEKSIVIKASPAQCFKVISDYERYPEFLEDMRAARVIRRDGTFALVTFTLELVMRIEYTLRLFEEEPKGLRWSLDEGKLMKVNNGHWRLKDLGNGSTEATYSIELELKGLIPKSVTTKLAGTTLPKTLESFKRRIESLK